VYANANVATYLSNYDGGINFTASPAVITGLGNISSANFTFGNGVNILSTVPGTYGNANVASYLPTYAGNITASNISLTGNTGFPSNTSTVQAWARVTIGTTAYWTPLYQ
jgi:hypothetical protein